MKVARGISRSSCSNGAAVCQYSTGINSLLSSHTFSGVQVGQECDTDHAPLPLKKKEPDLFVEDY